MELKKIIASIAGIIFTTSAATVVAEESLIKLTDTQLDTISAGFVELTITANSFAAGSDDVVALAYTNTDVRSNRGGRTVARGNATTTAIGEIISTETGYSLNTDEHIVLLRAVQRIRNSESGTVTIRTRVHRNGRVSITTTHKPPRNRRGNRGRNRNRNTTETNTLRLRVVTRR